MTATKRKLPHLLALLALLTTAACGTQARPDHDPQPQAPAASPLPDVSTQHASSNTGPLFDPDSRARFAQVQFAYPNSRCAYPYSPTNFCDDTHQKAYAHALESTPANFDHDLILLAVDTRPEYHQKSLVVLEPDTGIVWPFPFDAYAGPLDGHGNPTAAGTLEFSSDSSTVCIDGSLLVYRAIEPGRFCFTFDGGRFEGHTTQYTQESGG